MLDHTAGTTIVSLDGSFDLAQRGKMSDAFSAALGSHLIVVDCLRATYLDSTALGCILRLRREAIENHRELVVVASSSRVKRLFELCGLAQFVEMRASVEEIGGERIAGNGSYVQWIDLVSDFSD
jgi:anti-anti-sigma factor